ncbi:MAG: hypothetical protein J7K96_09305 [Desulfobacteraceae bacterium]|nr:hypothetical protein [Desulfobacteraceae bacterium]
MLPPSICQDAGGKSLVQVVGDGPDVNERPLYSGVLAALHQARESIFVSLFPQRGERSMHHYGINDGKFQADNQE